MEKSELLERGGPYTPDELRKIKGNDCLRQPTLSDLRKQVINEVTDSTPMSPEEQAAYMAVKHYERENDRLLARLRRQGRSQELREQLDRNKVLWGRAQEKLNDAQCEAARARGAISPIADEVEVRQRVSLRNSVR